MIFPVCFLTIYRTVVSLATPGTFLHFRVREFLFTCIALDALGLVLSPFFSVTLFSQTFGLMLFLMGLAACLAAVSFGQAIATFDC
jgi:hypothetical protein